MDVFIVITQFDNHCRLTIFLETYGEEWFIEQLKSWSKREYYKRSSIDDLEAMVTELQPRFKKVTAWLVSYQRERIFEADRDRERSGRKELLASEEKHLQSVIALLRSAVFHPQEAEVMVAHILEHQEIYLPTSTMKLSIELRKVRMFENLCESLESSARARLSEIISRKRNPNDWSINTLPLCNCNDCKILKNFLSNSSLRSYVWPLAKDRRQHIHQIIDGSALPVTHVTRRDGSPHKLVLEKTDELFSLEKSEKRAAQLALKRLQEAFSR
jgi:hypothetical protein